MNKDKSNILEFFRSIKVAIVLLTLIILVSCLGSFIPQELSAEEYINKYGEQFYNFILRLGLTDIYHSLGFILLLVLFGFSLLVCTLNRIKLWRKDKLGLTITHLSLLVTFIGFIISAIFGERGFMPLYEGQSSDEFFIGDKARRLNFKVHLDDFSVEWYNIFNHQVSAYVKDANIKQDFTVEVGKSYPINGTGYQFAVLRYIPDFYLDERGVKTRGEMPSNPALLVQVNNSGQPEKEKWLFSQFPAFSHNPDSNLEVTYKFNGRIKSFISKVTILEGDKAVLRGNIEVNHPLIYKGYTFYQASYDPEKPDWTGFRAVKDPGVWPVYAGFILLNIGVILTFFVKLKENKTKGTV